MIICGGSRSNGSYFAKHLCADHNERAEVIEMRGLLSENLHNAFQEMEALASGTKCKNYFYHASLNCLEYEHLTAEQWKMAVDTLERNLNLCDQPRIVVEHEKDGRIHRHVAWSRIDVWNMTAISDSLTYPKHEQSAREIEALFGLEQVDSVLVKDRPSERPERNPRDWESLRGQETKIDPKEIKRELSELWSASDSGPAFVAALHDRGYILTQGDRRDFCIIDHAGKEHSLAKRLTGVKARDLREWLSDIDRDTLPSVAEGRELALQRLDAEDTTSAPMATPAPDVEPVTVSHEDALFDRLHAETVGMVQLDAPGVAPYRAEPLPEPIDAFSAAHHETIGQARADTRAVEIEEATTSGARFERFRAWWGNVAETFSEWRGYVQERYAAFRSRWDDDPSPTPNDLPEHGMEPGL